MNVGSLIDMRNFKIVLFQTPEKVDGIADRLFTQPKVASQTNHYGDLPHYLAETDLSSKRVISGTADPIRTGIPTSPEPMLTYKFIGIESADVRL